VHRNTFWKEQFMVHTFLLKQVADCPYCGNRLAVDAASGKVIYDVETMKEPSRPCPHLACFWICVGAGRSKPDGSYANDDKRTKSWLWEHGRGIYPVNVLLHEDHMEWIYYLCDYGWKSLPTERRLTSLHQFFGQSAMLREATEPGSGEFVLGRDGEDLLHVTVDAYAIFAPEPATVVKELRDLVKGYMGRGPDGSVARFFQEVAARIGAKA
jgi:hypothetical protein